MFTCSNCQHELDEEVHFCPNCGEKAPEPVSVQQPKAQKPIEFLGVLKWLQWGLISVMFFLLLYVLLTTGTLPVMYWIIMIFTGVGFVSGFAVILKDA